jgi:uncharacterized membrane protein
MRRIVVVLVAVVALAGAVHYLAPTSGQANGEAAPVFGGKIPPGYREGLSHRLLNWAERGGSSAQHTALATVVKIAEARSEGIPT